MIDRGYRLPLTRQAAVPGMRSRGNLDYKLDRFRLPT
jgi:hypothetical protein